MKNHLILMVILLGVPFFALAQTTHQSISQSLSTPNSSSGAKVVIKSNTPIELTTGNQQDKVKGYHVRIYSGNSQDSRGESQSAKSRFDAMFPHISSNVEYTAPYFKVTVGTFLTREEAIILWGRLVGEFPTAYVINQQVPISTFSSYSSATTTTTSLEATTPETMAGGPSTNLF